MVHDVATGRTGRCFLFHAHIQYVRPTPHPFTYAFTNSRSLPPPPNMTPGRPTTITVLKAEATGLIYRAWEPYQREPRWEIQAELLEKLLEHAENRMKARYGGNYRSKLLRKAMGDDIALDERAAYATMHTMGGPDGGGEWVHVPAGMDEVPDEMHYPRRDPGDWERYQEWRRENELQLERDLLHESGFYDDNGLRRKHDKLLVAGGVGQGMNSDGVTHVDGCFPANAGRPKSTSSSAQHGHSDASHGSAARSTPSSSEPLVQPDKKKKKKRYFRSKAGNNEHLEPISSKNEDSDESEVEEKAETKA